MTDYNFEIQLILNICQPNLSVENCQKIEELLKKDLDWIAILNITKQHGISCLFYQQIKTFKTDLIPTNILDLLHNIYLQNSYKNIKFTGELLRLIKRFENKNIPVISFKGPVLAQLNYNNLGMREFEDLDLLIPEDRVILVDSLLKDQGYLPQFQLTNEQLNIYFKIRSELIYYHPQKEITIDLHWCLLPRYFSFSDQTETIWQNNQEISLNNHQINTLNNEINLLFLCSHASKHDWLYLCWFVDLAVFINNNADLDWDFIINQSGHIATRKMLFLGLYLTYDLFNISLPEEIIKNIKKEPNMLELVEEVKSKLWQNQDVKEGYITPKIYLKTMDKLRDKIWFWFDTILTPTPIEWEIIKLPAFLFFVYYFIRLFRLILKYIFKLKL